MKDFNKLYQLQNKFLNWLYVLNMPCYLTGGTALGRFYLGHRFCDNLYFHVNDSYRYLDYISKMSKKIEDTFKLDLHNSQFNEEYTQLIIIEDDLSLKIEFIRNISFNPNKLAEYKFGQIDTPANILPKKLKAMLWRHNVEDLFDIVHIAQNYSFNWGDVSSRIELFAKYTMHDIKKRLATHPTGSIKKTIWPTGTYDSVDFKKALEQIAFDFEGGGDNSLGTNKLSIEMAKPFLEFQIQP